MGRTPGRLPSIPARPEQCQPAGKGRPARPVQPPGCSFLAPGSCRATVWDSTPTRRVGSGLRGGFTRCDFWARLASWLPGVGSPTKINIRKVKAVGRASAGSAARVSVIDLDGQRLRGAGGRRLGSQPHWALLPADHLLPLAEVVPRR